MLASKTIDSVEIEARYRRSPYVQDICVIRLTRDDNSLTESLLAVVVPNLELMRQRRIVNVGDILRFEMEGQSIHLPADQRVGGYDIWFEPLPRTTSGELDRRLIEDRVREKQRLRDSASIPDVDHTWAGDPHARAVVAAISKHTRAGVGDGVPDARTLRVGVGHAAISANANLEVDLGIDSMARVELITELEERFGVRIPDERALGIFTVGQLVEAMRLAPDDVDEPRGTTDRAAPAARLPVAMQDSWAALLRHLPPPGDALLRHLLEPRPVAARLFFLLPRLLRLMMPPILVSGFEHLPANGPYIITPNHQGYLDPFIVCGLLPFRIFRHVFFVGAAEYFETPFMRWLAKAANCVPVDPDAYLVPAMRAGAFGLTHGKILMLFPEGERSIDGAVKRFKKGAAILARHLDVPIVPVAIEGAFELWPRNRPINWRVLLPWSRHRIRVTFGAPVRLEQHQSHADAAAELRAIVQDLLTRAPSPSTSRSR